MHWLEARCAELADGGALQIMYGIDGREDLDRADAAITSRATAAPRRCASATAPPTSSSSTSTAS